MSTPEKMDSNPTPQAPREDLETLKALSDALEFLVAVGRKLIRKKAVEDLLYTSTDTTAFWEIYFRILMKSKLILGQGVNPDVFDGANKDLEKALEGCLKEVFDGLPAEEEKKARQRFAFWKKKRAQQIWHCVAQFWNAANRRSSSFVTNSLTPEGDFRPAFTWRQWRLMTEINKIEKKDGEDIPPNSIGNFVVTRCRDGQDICPIFQFFVGPETNNPQALCVPRSFVQELTARLRHLLGLQGPPGQLGQLMGQQAAKDHQVFGAFWIQKLQRKEEVMRALVKDETLWAPHHATWAEFFADVYGIPVGGAEFSERNLRWLVLNNLFALTNLFAELLAARDGESCGYHYHYCIPVWHLSTSYIYITTSAELTGDELACFANFAHGIMGVAWAADSVRQQEAQKQRIIDASRTAARAAVLARNFSHVTGSHIIANPNFAAALVGTGPLVEWAAQLAFQAKEFDGIYRGYATLPTASGTGWAEAKAWERAYKLLNGLADDAESVGDKALRPTQQFHQYLQGRFDFIARAIDQTHDRNEPVFFIADILNGFLSQAKFLEALVADLAVQLRSLKFRVILPDGSQFETLWGQDPATRNLRHDWRSPTDPQDKVGEHEVLLGIPGGMISCHAFYAILENLIRNSIKYGSDKGKKPYAITLQLRPPDANGNYRLRIWDTWSGLGEGHRVFALMRGHLSQPLLTTEGARAKALGLQEMVICADGIESGHARAERTKANEGRDELEQTKSLRLVPPEECQDDRLTYEFSISEPVLAGIWTQNSEIQKHGIVRRAKCLVSLLKRMKEERTAGFAAHLFVIDSQLGHEKVIELIEKHHAILPYRLFVVCPPEQAEAWRQAVRAWENKPGSTLPAGRLRIVADGALAAQLGMDLTAVSEPEKMAFTIACYDAWLRAWKGGAGAGADERGKGRKGERETTPSPSPTHPFPHSSASSSASWDLWLGFEKGNWPDDTWRSLLGNFEKYLRQTVSRDGDGGGQVRVFVRLANSGDQPGPPLSSNGPPEEGYWEREFAAPMREKRALVFDHHGTCFPETQAMEEDRDLREGARFYQKFGAETADLYRHLSNPPTDAFAFAYFIYSLVESCLANIAVVDERLAADLLFDRQQPGKPNSPQLFREYLSSHLRAGVFPLFSFAFPGSAPREGDPATAAARFYTKAHGQALQAILHESATGPWPEGIQVLLPEGRMQAKAVIPQETGFAYPVLQAASAWESPPEFPLDALVIHEGAIDLLVDRHALPGGDAAHPSPPLHEILTQKLLEFTPMVIRTSGRGRDTKYFSADLPFIEFNEVSSAVLTARNKYSLVRGLFGASGRFSEPGLTPKTSA